MSIVCIFLDRLHTKFNTQRQEITNIKYDDYDCYVYGYFAPITRHPNYIKLKP